jgi:hypothetical protein
MKRPNPIPELLRNAGAAPDNDTLLREQEAFRRLKGKRRGFGPLAAAGTAAVAASVIMLPELRSVFLPGQVKTQPPSPEPLRVAKAPEAAVEAAAAAAPPAPQTPERAAVAASPSLPTALTVKVDGDIVATGSAEPARSPAPAVAAAVARPSAPPAATVPAAPAMPPAAPSVAIPTAEVQRLIVRGAELVTQGDIAGARLVLARASSGGDPRATFALAETYDPTVLAAWKARGIKGDPERAKALYREALMGGVAQAETRLSGLP